MEPVRVLVVDDDEALCEMMVGHLRRKGFLVESAKDGMEAIQILRTIGPFCVMVTDLMMPGMSGLELLRRGKKLDPLIEVIVITAAGSIEMAISALREDGAYDYLTKPLGMIGELSLAVERAATHRQMKLEREAIRGSLINGTRRLKEILSSTGIPIFAGNEKDEIIFLSPNEASAEFLQPAEEDGKKDRLREPFQSLVRRWRSLGGTQVAWIELKGVNGKEFLVKISPLPIGENVGWVMVFDDITYMKRLERFVVGNYAKIVTKIQQPVEKAMDFLADLEQKWNQGEGDPLEQLGHLKEFFQEAQNSTNDLLDLTCDERDSSAENESISLHEFLLKTKDLYQSEISNGKGDTSNWQFIEELPLHTVDYALVSELFHHLLQHAKLRTDEKAGIQVKGWAGGLEIWLSVIDSGPKTIVDHLDPSLNGRSEHPTTPFSHAQVELALVKLLAEQMGCQVWIQEFDRGGCSVSICFLIEQRDKVVV